MNAPVSDAPTGSDDRFPAPVYARTVLAPAFAHSQRHHLAHLLRLHRAHGVMLAEQELLTRDEAVAIFGALDAVEGELTQAEPAAYTGEHEDLFFFIETKLAGLIGKDIAGRLHTGRSRNDIDHTLFKLALRERLDALGLQLLELIATLIRRSREEAATLILAYTHGQPAQPSTYGHYLGAVIEVLLRDVTRLMQAREVVDLSTMGAAAITTTGFPLDRARVAALLGFPDFLRNSYGCIASADYTAGVYSALRVLALNLGRFAQDLAFWTSFEVGQLRFSDGFVQISSIMPQKRNPVPVEHLRLMASLTAGKCDAVLQALHNTPFTDMNDNEHEVHGQGYEAFEMAERALALFGGVVASARIDEKRARANIEASYATITELADTLVRREALPFAITHHVAAAMAKHLQATCKTLGTVPYGEFVSLFTQVVGRAPVLTEAEFREAVTPDYFVSVRTLPGGPAPAAIAASLAIYEEQTAAARALIDRHAARDAAAKRVLDEAIIALGAGKGA